MELLQGSNAMRHVLIVENDDDVRSALRDSLEASRYRASSAADARQALALVARYCPDASIVDAVLGRRSGLELAHKLTQRQVPVLMMTGNPAMLIRFRKCGVPFLNKPFGIDALVAELETVIRDGERRIRELRGLLEVLMAEHERLLAVTYAQTRRLIANRDAFAAARNRVQETRARSIRARKHRKKEQD